MKWPFPSPAKTPDRSLQNLPDRHTLSSSSMRKIRGGDGGTIPTLPPPPPGFIVTEVITDP